MNKSPSWIGVLLVGVVLALFAGFVIWWKWPPPIINTALSSYKEATRDALVATADPYGDVADTIVYLDQGWTPAESMDFYTHTQGSRLLPYPWFLALEQPANERPFREPANITRLRYLPQKANAINPDALPVGFVKDPKRPGGQEDWLGMNCAACHTTQVNYQKVGYRIDGGPTMADHETFLNELTLALKNTLADSAKFERFAAKVLPKDHTDADKSKLQARLGKMFQFRSEFDARNRSNSPYGFARLDAFGRILNELFVHDLGVTAEGQGQVADAPVSYPFLWDTPHHDFVQWNAIAANKIGGSETLGALTRNVGEVIGVFGEVDIPQPGAPAPLLGYNSSVRVPDLIDTEKLLRKLESPQWPKAFPPIDEGQRQKGEKLFATYCLACHAEINRTDPNREVKANQTLLIAVRTDPAMATNFGNRHGKTGPLAGKKAAVLVGNPLGDDASGVAVLSHTVLGVILNTPFNGYKESDLLEVRKPVTFALFGGLLNSLVYKGRPLNGIWATAPYLHNGSVPNLWQLLLPAEKRDAQFYVGRREFDPKNVGFKTEAFTGGFLFRTTDEAGKPIRGNSNAGHEYGTGKKAIDGGDDLRPLTDDERWQLVEYLKSL